MDTHKNARLTPEGRGAMSVAVVDRAKQSRGCALIQYDPGDRLFLAAIIGRAQAIAAVELQAGNSSTSLSTTTAC
jgi:hypothetical protein